jgi:hypothetical protein
LNLPIILLTENLRGFTGRPRDSIKSFSKTLYRFGEFSATEISVKPTLCDAASDAPSVSGICENQIKIISVNNAIIKINWVKLEWKIAYQRRVQQPETFNVKPTSDKDLVYVNHEKHEITKSS